MYQIPLNRIVAFAGPYISVIAGGIASWLVARVNIAGVPGLDQSNLQTSIAGGLTFVLVSGLSWAGHSKWLSGHQVQMETDAQVSATAMSLAVTAAPGVDALSANTSGNGNGNGNGFHPEDVPATTEATVVEDATADAVADDDLPTDEEEFASPPTPVPYGAAEPESVS
jgi:hypothetical protein